MSNDSDPSSGTIFKWSLLALAFFVVLSCVLAVTGAAGDVFGIFVNRKAVEQSVQYSTANTDAFYTNLAAVKKIEVQLAAPDISESMASALRSQKEMLETEMRRVVAKVPADSRTTDMLTYGGSSR